MHKALSVAVFGQRWGSDECAKDRTMVARRFLGGPDDGWRKAFSMAGTMAHVYSYAIREKGICVITCCHPRKTPLFLKSKSFHLKRVLKEPFDEVLNKEEPSSNFAIEFSSR